MKKNEPINITSVASAVAALVIGIILLFNDKILDIIGYIVSGSLFLYGVIKTLVLFRRKKKGFELELGDYMSVFGALLFSIIIAIFPKSISITVSLVLGTFAIIVGLNRLILGLTVRKIDEQGAKIFIIESILVIILGIIIITQKFLSLLGIFLIIYAISELFSYVYYKSQNKDYSEVLNKKISKEIKESKSIEAVIEEK